MKKTNVIAAVIFAASLAMGMGTYHPAIATNEAPAAITNAPPPVVVVPPAAQADDVIAVGTFVRPAIGIHNGQTTVAAEGPNMASIWTYQLNANGKWQGGKSVQGSDVTAGRTYGPGVAGGIPVFRFGPKGDHGTWKGPGLIMPDGRVIRTGLSTGVGRLAVDGSKLVLMGKDAAWAYVNTDGSLGQRGQWKGLTTGEKLAFDIQGGVWACAMGGYSKQDASVGIGNASGCKVVRVAAFTNYPSMGPDPNWPGVAVAPDGSVWFASAYSGQLRVNCVAAGKARWPIDALPSLGECITGDRCPPRLVTARGRVFAVWEAPGKAIMLVDVEKCLKGKVKPTRICTGSQPAVAVDPAGRLVVVYVSGGAIRVRTLN